MVRRAALLVSVLLVALGLAVPGGAAAPVVGPSVVADPGPPGGTGRPPEELPSAEERQRSDRLAADPLQETGQPVQQIVPTAQAGEEARPVRLLNNGAWTWYTDPRVLETSRQTYLGYVTRGGSVGIAAVRRNDARMTSTVLSKYQLPDDHNVPALLESAGGRIVTFWAGHGRAPVRYKVSRSSAGAIDSMSSARPLTGSGLENADATYVQAFRMRGVSHQYHVLTRRYSDQNWVLTTSKDLQTWTTPVQLFRHSSWSVRTWPYLEVGTAGWRQMHLAITDGHPAQDIDTSLHHFTYDAATRTMRTSSGAVVRRPADPRSGTKVYDGTSADGRVRVYDIAMRPDGRPALAFTTVDRSQSTKGYTYKWATLGTTEWRIRTVARQADYPEGMTVDQTNGDRVYVVDRVGGDTQLSELSSLDAGETWQSRAVSRQPGVQRTPATPFGSHGAFSVLWLHGEYGSYWDYSTGIVGETTGRAPIQLAAGFPDSWARGGGVSGSVRAGRSGPGVPGTRVWLLVRKPGEPQRWMHSSVTDSDGRVHLAVNRYYPRGTAVRLHVPATARWGLATSPARHM